MADRLIKRHKAERETLRIAKDKQGTTAEQAARSEINALILFRRNLGAYLRVYSFLSQIFDGS